MIRVAGSAVMIAIAAGGMTGTAKAVDVENRDSAAREVIVNRSDGSSDTLTVEPKKKLADVCQDCVIVVGESSVEAAGRVTVRIEGGKVSIATRR